MVWALDFDMDEPRLSDRGASSQSKRIFCVDAEMPNRALDSGVPEQDLTSQPRTLLSIARSDIANHIRIGFPDGLANAPEDRPTPIVQGLNLLVDQL